MKTPLILASLLAALSLPAYANNAQVEAAIKADAELAVFYQALANTGVLQELKANRSYTVFAPTNTAFTEVTTGKYPCFYASECKAQVATVLRNHIVEGKVRLSDSVKYKGGLHSLDKGFLYIGEVNPNYYEVNSRSIIAAKEFSGGALYKVDGVLANARELSAFYVAPASAAVAGAVVCTLPGGCPVVAPLPVAVAAPVAAAPMTLIPAR